MFLTDPLVSVIVPSFNQVRFLETTLESIRWQDYPSLETIVIDGGSTDGSLDVLRRHADRLTRWVSEPDAGQADAINKGLKLARGEIVAWLNSDDLYLPGAVGAAVRALQAHPEAGMAYADGVLIDEQATLLDWHRYRPYALLDLLCFEVLLQPTVFMRRAALETVGGLRTDYRLILDHDLWIRMAALGPIHHVPAYWAAERTHPQAKTVAAAADFTAEAGRLIGEARRSPSLAPLIAAHHRRVSAGLECFSGRRLIDADRFGPALRHFARGLAIHPFFTLRYWYKIAQAGMGAVGLAGAFRWYRTSRRRLVHGRQRLVLDSGAARWERVTGP